MVLYMLCAAFLLLKADVQVQAEEDALQAKVFTLKAALASNISLYSAADVQVHAAEGSLVAAVVSSQATPADKPSLNSNAPVTASDLRITGVTMTGPNTGWVYLGDTITCTGYSTPSPVVSSYFWNDLETGQVLQAQSIQFSVAATTRITCKASNVVSGVTYSATTDPLSVTTRSSENTGAKSTQASIVLFATLILLLRYCN